MVKQDKDKYGSPKYRFVVRVTNRQCIVQVMAAKIQGDVCLTRASSLELSRYGIPEVETGKHGPKKAVLGATNYAACYATGLLAARRLLQSLKLDGVYGGVTEADGEFFEIEPADEGAGPFKCILDVGLKRTTTGAKVFAAMKGGADGGLLIPHEEKRFPGFDEGALETEVLKDHIFANHVGEYMDYLEEEDEERHAKQFAHYIKAGISGEGFEEMWKGCHAAIRADPKAGAKNSKDYAAWGRKSARENGAYLARQNYQQRKASVLQRIQTAQKNAREEAENASSEEEGSGSGSD